MVCVRRTVLVGIPWMHLVLCLQILEEEEVEVVGYTTVLADGMQTIRRTFDLVDLRYRLVLLGFR